MNDQINRKIAEALGWTEWQIQAADRVRDAKARLRIIPRKDSFSGQAAIEAVEKAESHKDYIGPVPDFCGSLDAMNSAEAALIEKDDADTFEKYVNELCRIVDLEGGYYVCATTRQRAEAFLRTRGLWED